MHTIAPITGMLLMFWAQISLADTLTGRVTSVLSGDTFAMLANDDASQTITLSEVETPEDTQPFSEDAKQALREKTLNKTVTVTYTPVPDSRGIRGKVMVGNRWLNRDMVAAGWAWHVRSESNNWELARSEKEARRQRRGLWQDPTPTAPWVYREEAKREAQFLEAWESDVRKDKLRKKGGNSKRKSSNATSTKGKKKKSGKGSAASGGKKSPKHKGQGKKKSKNSRKSRKSKSKKGFSVDKKLSR